MSMRILCLLCCCVAAQAAVTITSVNFTPTTINENGVVNGTIDFTGATVNGSYTVTINWGDGSSDVSTVTATLNAGSATVSHTYLDDGTSPGNGTASDNVTITVTVEDDLVFTDFDTDSSTIITINNVSPSLGVPPDSTIGADRTYQLSATYSDPGTLDELSYTVDWGDATANSTGTATGGIITANHVYTATGSYTVTVTIDDDDTGSASDTFTLTVDTAPTTALDVGTFTIEGTTAAQTVLSSLGPDGIFTDNSGTWTVEFDLSASDGESGSCTIRATPTVSGATIEETTIDISEAPVPLTGG